MYILLYKACAHVKSHALKILLFVFYRKFIYLSAYLFIYLSIYVSTYPFVYLSIYFTMKDTYIHMYTINNGIQKENEFLFKDNHVCM